MDDERDATIRELTRIKCVLTEQLKTLLLPVREVEEQLSAVTHTLKVLGRRNDQTVEAVGFPAHKLQGKTQIEALFEIADFNGGVLDVTEARPLLIAAKLMKDSPNASQMVNLLINRSGAFERVGRGKYRRINRL